MATDIKHKLEAYHLWICNRGGFGTYSETNERCKLCILRHDCAARTAELEAVSDTNSEP